MTQSVIHNVSFYNQFEDSSEKYFYQFAMDTLIKKSDLFLESLEGDFLKNIYGVILQQIFADYCNCRYDGEFDFEYDEMEYPLDGDTLSVMHKYYFCDIDDAERHRTSSEDEIFFDYNPEKLTDREIEYYEEIECKECTDLLEELIAHFRPVVVKLLCDNYSTSMLYSAMTYALEKKTVLVEEECGGEIEYYEEEVNYESFDEYLTFVNSCAVCNDLSGIKAFEWINEGMYDRS